MPPRSLIAQFAKDVHAGGMAEFAQGASLDLPDPFAGDPHDQPDFLEGKHPSRTINGYPNASFAQALFVASLEAWDGNVINFLHVATDA